MRKHLILRYKVILIVLLLSILPVNAEDDTPLDKFLNKLETFQADFKQTLINEKGEELESVTGIVYMQSPGKFRWDYKDPYSQMIITDGRTLWVYDEDLEQVTIKDISETIDEHFVIIEMGDIYGYDWIELTPKNVENQYSMIRMGFDKDRLGMMVMFDNLGQTTRIDFHNPMRNKGLESSLFRFEPPEGVDIIDDRS